MPDLTPGTMKVVEIARPGGPDVLRIVERPVPEAGNGEVLIRVAGAGVNRPDLMQREGRYPPPPCASDIPGLEVAGTIVGLGPGAGEWEQGDQVCALVAGGGYAEYCAAPAAQCLRVPRGMTTIEAAAIPETFFTVWTNVFERGRLAEGESFLVHGGASGIGTAAIQLARAFGARVFATAGTADKCAACAALGAERAIDYRVEDFVAVLRALTGSRGIDVILDMVGGPYFSRNLDVLAMEGRLVQIAFLQGPNVEMNLWRIMQRRLTITGSTLRARSVAEKGAIAEALRVNVWPLLDKGIVKPVIHDTFPLERAADAHVALERGDHVGKIVLIADS